MLVQFRRVRELEDKVFDIVKDQYTIDLAYYEIGNFLWKNYVRKIFTKEEIERYLETFRNLLDKMHVLNIELINEVLELSVKLRLTYYNASYLYAALKTNAVLVTEDLELYEKAKSLVKVSKISEIIK